MRLQEEAAAAEEDDFTAVDTEAREHFRTLIQKAVERSALDDSPEDAKWAIAVQYKSAEALETEQDPTPFKQLNATAAPVRVRLC